MEKVGFGLFLPISLPIRLQIPGLEEQEQKKMVCRFMQTIFENITVLSSSKQIRECSKAKAQVLGCRTAADFGLMQ